MKWLTNLFTSTLGRKLLMALTGLFLITFLAVHLAGNLQLLKDDGGKSFNIYAEFMSTNPLIQTISKVNFALILIHVIWAILLSRKNRDARGSSYAVTNKSSHWTSRNMGILGTIVLVFITIHLKDFWAQMHFGSVPTVDYDGKQVRDLASIVSIWFDKAWYVALYVFCMAAVAFHLWHGFSSAFQTLGLNHVKYNPVINFVGRAFAIIVPALFALIPIMMFLN
ncbi:MAG TPA: succinate dehydrogenase cytochrome b subunit [Cyclobacteriaceae bacterium]|nr:succinate dehydrogenase cytochrome b subunit [Cyclobacteriaceae bacterium]HRX00331.1 succinate dehydrogenase cytochrome b subunit [Cyclobacteriaceae bacterium]